MIVGEKEPMPESPTATVPEITPVEVLIDRPPGRPTAV